MSIETPTATRPNTETIPELVAGDRLTRAEFERRYHAMPNVRKAELIEGVVYMPSPVSHVKHGRPQMHLVGWILHYIAYTPGSDGGDNSTLRLDLDNEPQPDAFLLVLPENGGQSRTVSGYVEGAPELVAEVSSSSASYDLHDKLNAYRRNGVCEYIVWRVRDRAIDWFVLREGKYEQLPQNDDGIMQSEIFPGLWLDSAALIDGKLKRVLDVVHEGTKSPEHAAFVEGIAKSQKMD